MNYGVERRNPFVVKFYALSGETSTNSLKKIRVWTGKCPSTGLNCVRVAQRIYSDGRVSLIDDERPGRPVSKKSLFTVN